MTGLIAPSAPATTLPVPELTGAGLEDWGADEFSEPPEEEPEPPDEDPVGTDGTVGLGSGGGETEGKVTEGTVTVGTGGTGTEGVDTVGPETRDVPTEARALGSPAMTSQARQMRANPAASTRTRRLSTGRGRAARSPSRSVLLTHPGIRVI